MKIEYHRRVSGALFIPSRSTQVCYLGTNTEKTRKNLEGNSEGSPAGQVGLEKETRRKRQQREAEETARRSCLVNLNGTAGRCLGQCWSS